MVDQALDLVIQAASHYMLGDLSCVAGVATGGTTASLVDGNLITSDDDSSFQGYWLYIIDGPAGGSERFITSLSGTSGSLNFGNLVSSAPVAGNRYLLLRDARFFRWLDWLNDAARNLHYQREVYLAGVTNQLRYTLPTPLSYGGWVEDVLVSPSGFRFTDEAPRGVDWYRIDPLNIVGDLYLVLRQAITARDQLVFRARPPYLHQQYSAYTMTQSVLTPFGETVPVTIPRQLIVAGATWRALKQKLVTLTGASRQQWTQNAETFAREYANLCRQHGVTHVGRELGYSEPWY